MLALRPQDKEDRLHLALLDGREELRLRQVQRSLDRFIAHALKLRVPLDVSSHRIGRAA